VELKDYWHTIRHRWMAVALCVLVAVGAAAFATMQATPQYSSTAQLFVSTSQEDTADAYQGGLFASQRVASYVDVVTSEDLAVRVSSSLDEDIDPAELVDKVQAQVRPETVILQITATDPDPEVAQEIAQAYAEEMITTVRDLETPAGADKAPIKASLIDHARVASSPVSPQPLRNLALALVLGLLLGIGVAVLREILDNSVTSAEDVTQVTAAPIVGHIATDPAAVGEDPAVALDSVTPWAEAFRMLRTNMQYVQVDSDTKTFVVTSSLPGEGKTTTAINLAVTLAMARQQRIALVECDLRRPLVASRLGLVGQIGTTTVLVGKVSLDMALQEYRGTGLHVLTSGAIPPNPSELLQSHAMEAMLAELRERFDVVILDAPPLLPVTDAALLAAQADGALVVTQHSKTTRDQLAHALERLDAVEARTLGVVINQAPAKKGSSYGYGYGYAYGYAPENPPVGDRDEAHDTRPSIPGRRRAV
jgi:capsular exopolysaccharide synthesis family protein